MTTQRDDHMRLSNPNSTDAEAAAQAALQKMRVVTRIISACGILLIFDVGKTVWPSWLVDYQLHAFFLIILALIFSILITPRVVAAAARSHSYPE